MTHCCTFVAWKAPDLNTEDHFTDHGSKPEDDQQRSSERVFLSERAGRRVYRQMENTERSLGTKLDTLIQSWLRAGFGRA